MSADRVIELPIGEEDEFRGLGDGLLTGGPARKIEPVIQLPKGPRLKKTIKQKALRVMLKRSGMLRPPHVETILEGKTGPRIPISEIGFISNNKQADPLIASLAKECPIRNRLNRDDIKKSRILAVGSQIFKDGHMWTPIHVHRDLHDGRFECISGRHRLAFLALVYGPDLEIPVYLENLTLKAAREATAVANDSRPVKSLERASYAILRAVGGDSAADQGKLYAKLANLKPNVVKYCVYSVMERGYPEKLTFKLSELPSRPDGGITTVSNVEEFWSEALLWTKGMDQKEFDHRLGDSVKFINAFVTAIQKVSGFDPDQHLTSNVLWAVGRYYADYNRIKNPIFLHDEIARAVVAMGRTDREKQSDLHLAIANILVGSEA
jgi:hypothetical protein